MTIPERLGRIEHRRDPPLLLHRRQWDWGRLDDLVGHGRIARTRRALNEMRNERDSPNPVEQVPPVEVAWAGT